MLTESEKHHLSQVDGAITQFQSIYCRGNPHLQSTSSIPAGGLLGDHSDLANAREDLQEGRVLIKHRGTDRVDGTIEERWMDDVSWRIEKTCGFGTAGDGSKPRVIYPLVI